MNRPIGLLVGATRTSCSFRCQFNVCIHGLAGTCVVNRPVRWFAYASEKEEALIRARAKPRKPKRFRALARRSVVESSLVALSSSSSPTASSSQEPASRPIVGRQANFAGRREKEARPSCFLACTASMTSGRFRAKSPPWPVGLHNPRLGPEQRSQLRVCTQH